MSMNLYLENIDDTICAITTPFGIGGISVIRVSGTDAVKIVDRIFVSVNCKECWYEHDRKAILGNIFDENKDFIDEVICTVFYAPKSFTGENTVEISCHGSLFIQQEILRLLINNGCRMATNGEFSKRAFFNGKLDLSQAESIADIISCESKAQHKIAMNQLKGNYSRELNNLRDQMLSFATLIELELDFSEEDVEFANRDSLKKLINDIENKIKLLTDSFKKGNSIKKGVPTAIVGVTNVGKSTILNRLIGEDKAIVSNIPGTTRDIIEDTLNINGILYRFIDTAGLRKTEDEIESLGIKKSFEVMQKAELLIIVASVESIDSEDCNNYYKKIIRESDIENKIIVINKVDINSECIDFRIKQFIDNISCGVDIPFICISAKNDSSIDPLKNIIDMTYKNNLRSNSDIVVSNARHYNLLCDASNAIEKINISLDENTSSELLAQDMRLCINYIGEITGQAITSDNILHNIFKNFCIGK